MVGKKLLLSMVMLGAGIMSVAAQGYYDDDIYYDPAKDTKAKQEKLERTKRKQAAAASQYYNQYNYDPTLGGHDYAGADTYSVTGTSTRDVDEYNRRGKYAPVDTAAGRQAMSDDFAYTRRIEKYHNNDIISDINDPALVEYYYSAQPDVNIIINSPGWYSPWAWNYYDWYWGPSWSWPYSSSWWWGPSWSWGWGGPSWSWGWDPSWGWGPGWGWGGPAWRPGWGPGWAYNPGSYTPNGRRPVGVRNGYTGVTSNHYRPSYNGGNHRGFATGSTGNFRPGSTSGNRGNYGRPSNNSRPSNNGSYGTTTGNRNSNNRNNNYNYNRSNNNYNRSYSTPSYGGGSRGGYSGGGGGGGSHRGGRR